MENHQKRIEAAYLTKCSAQAAYDWLQERQIKDIYGWCRDYDNTLEYLLLKRNEPLIDLGIARYGHWKRAIEAVYRRSNTATKCAALGNPHIGYTRCNYCPVSGYGSAIVYSAINGANAELESLLMNPNLKEEVIEDLLGRKGLFEGKSDDEFIQMIQWLGINPRMKLDYDDTGQRWDGGADYAHNHVFYLAWRLAETLPTTQEFAKGLYYLLFGTKRVSAFDDIDSILERWRIEEGPHNEPSGYYSYWLRCRLADSAKADDKLLKSDDFALRNSFYRRFFPYEYEDWPLFIERDGKNAFDAIVLNDNLWQSADTRKTLNDVAWDKVPDPHHSLDAKNSYREVEKDRREKHPNWFIEEDLEWSNSSDAIIRRLGKKLEEQEEQKDITETLEELSESLSEQLETNKDKLEEEIRSSRFTIEDVQDKVSRRIDEALEKALQQIDSIRPPHPKPAAIWPWLIVIGLLIAILLK